MNMLNRPGMWVRPRARNMVANGSFETGDLTGWTVRDSPCVSVTSGQVAGCSPTGGRFLVRFDYERKAPEISQRIVLEKGRRYEFSCDVFGSGEVSLSYLSGQPQVHETLYEGSEPSMHVSEAFTAGSANYNLVFKWVYTVGHRVCGADNFRLEEVG